MAAGATHFPVTFGNLLTGVFVVSLNFYRKIRPGQLPFTAFLTHPVI